MNKQEFCQTLNWKSQLHWLDADGFCTLSHQMFARVSLLQDRTADHYHGFQVRIIHKEKGELDRKNFLFADYLGDYKIIAYCGWDWYINKPNDTTPLTNAAEYYINLFRPS